MTMSCCYLLGIEKLKSMNPLLYMAAVAVVILLPTTLTMEDNLVGIAISLAIKDINIVWYLLFNSALAYLINLTNFLGTKHTSALTLNAHHLFSLYLFSNNFFIAYFELAVWEIYIFNIMLSS